MLRQRLENTAHRYTQFTCFAGTKVQILTRDAQQQQSTPYSPSSASIVVGARYPPISLALSLGRCVARSLPLARSLSISLSLSLLRSRSHSLSLALSRSRSRSLSLSPTHFADALDTAVYQYLCIGPSVSPLFHTHTHKHTHTHTHTHLRWELNKRMQYGAGITAEL